MRDLMIFSLGLDQESGDRPGGKPLAYPIPPEGVRAGKTFLESSERVGRVLNTTMGRGIRSGFVSRPGSPDGPVRETPNARGRGSLRSRDRFDRGTKMGQASKLVVRAAIRVSDAG